jgi:dienelactone hydrolase
MYKKIFILTFLTCCCFTNSFAQVIDVSYSSASAQDLTPEEYLQQLMKVLPEDKLTDYRLPGHPPPRVSPEDLLWTDWLERTGELPPDFDEMPSLPFLPDPLILDEGGENIPVETMAQWIKKRDQIKKDAQYWITGTCPPPPENLEFEILEERHSGLLTERNVLLRFGPGHQAQLHVNLLIPPGEGPFPVFMCPWKKERYDWVQAAVRRGYVGCRFRATDPRYGWPDDSEAYREIWWPEYDFTTLMRWAWAASRAIDFLYLQDYVNTDQIALTGLSRNGKMALWAAAYDDRIKAVIPISGGTGGEIPFRYTADRYNIESIERMMRTIPDWLHPRLKFFTGRENKLPVDQNSLMALIAPRGLMITSSVHEDAGNPWATEQAWFSVRKVYEFLGAVDKIAIDQRQGLHAPSARDMERYLDFFDYIFGRGTIQPENRLVYNYTFSKWCGLSGEQINPLDYPDKRNGDLLLDAKGNAIKTTDDWQKKIPFIKKHIEWGLGEEPPSVAPGVQPDYMIDVVGYPKLEPEIASMPMQFGRLYFPSDAEGKPSSEKMPVVIYLHEYDYAQGYSGGGSEIFLRRGDLIQQFANAGLAVYLFDQIGFGTRIEEGRLFYERFPHWSKLGRMVADVRWSVDALMEIDFLDTEKICVAGYALGGTVALYSAALDERIAGVVSVCGFTPMRTNIPGKTAEGIYAFSHLHGLQPRLGFFAGEEVRIPYDFHEVLGCIAPRPLLIIAPAWDQFADNQEVKKCVDEVARVYRMYSSDDKIQLSVPDDYNRLSGDMRDEMIDWVKNIIW